MSDKMREALKLARKALRECGDALTAANIDGCPNYDDAMDAIEAALAEQPAQGRNTCEHGTVPAGMTCEVCYAEWNVGRRGPPHPPLAAPAAPPAPSVPDAVRVEPWSHQRDKDRADGWNACRAAMLSAAPTVAATGVES